MGGMRLTISKYYLPSGKSISEVGVTPDILVEEFDDDFKLIPKKITNLITLLNYLILNMNNHELPMRVGVGIIILNNNN